MNCKICKRLVVSDSVTYSNSQLLIDIPSATYGNGCKYCLIIVDAIPTTATVAAPVYITIGGVTTTTYPLLNCNGVQLTASDISTRMRYGVVVRTSTSGGSFVLTSKLACNNDGLLPSLPVAAAASAG